MKTIKSMLDERGNKTIFTVGPDDSVFSAVTTMVEKNIGAVLVKDGDAIVGILTERDYLRFIAAQGRTARDTPVRELMTNKVIYITPETELNEVMAIMTAERIRHLPVLKDDQLLGIVSIGDVVKQISHEQEVHIRTLEQYIKDPYPGPGTDR